MICRNRLALEELRGLLLQVGSGASSSADLLQASGNLRDMHLFLAKGAAFKC